MIPRLPHWVLTDKYPAFYDSESKTAIEMVAKIYAKMQELVDNYNDFVDPLNNEIAEYYKQLNAEYECFKASMIKIAHDYIMTIDEKIKMQDLVIKQYYETFNKDLLVFEELINIQFKNFTNNVNTEIDNQNSTIKDSVDYMKNKIKETTTEVANELLQNGKIEINHTYFSDIKKLLLVISNGSIIYNEDNKQLNLIIRTEV